MREISTVVIGITTNDLEASKAWVESVFDVSAPARELPGIAEYDLETFWLQVLSGAPSGGHGVSVSMSVPSVSALHAELAGRRHRVTEVQRMGDVVEFFEILDPDGNAFRFVTLLS